MTLVSRAGFRTKTRASFWTAFWVPDCGHMVPVALELPTDLALVARCQSRFSWPFSGPNFLAVSWNHCGAQRGMRRPETGLGVVAVRGPVVLVSVLRSFSCGFGPCRLLWRALLPGASRLCLGARGFGHGMHLGLDPRFLSSRRRTTRVPGWRPGAPHIIFGGPPLCPSR